MSRLANILPYFSLGSIFFLLGNASTKARNSEIAEILHRPIRALSYPESSTMGLFLALSVPLEEPYNSVSLSYFFEVSYGLPENSTFFDPTAEGLRQGVRRGRRGIDRATTYRVLESKFESSGYPGRSCLLRAICETSEYPIEHSGLIGDVLRVIFTPTSSRGEELPWDIGEAEVVGRNGSCTRYQPACPLGLFDFIGILA